MSPPSPHASPRQTSTPHTATPWASTPQALTAETPPTLLPEPMVQAFVCDIKKQPTTWNEEKGQPLFTLLKKSENKACIIFTTMEEFSTKIGFQQLRKTNVNIEQLIKLHLERQEKLREWFQHTPAVFWSDTCVEHNGFFGSNTSSTPICIAEPSPASSSTGQTATPAAVSHQEVVSTYFRLIVKTLVTARTSVFDYRWDEMGFLSISSDTKNLLVCFDVPADSITNLYQTLPRHTDQITGPFALHISVLEELVQLYDRSVWSMARSVREIEKRRLTDPGKRNAAKFFTWLSELTRHLAHGVETTQIAAEVVERMKITCESLRLAHNSSIITTRVQKLNFLHSMLRGLTARSVSNEKRLTSEQVLLSSTLSQADSTFSLQIALATKEDGAAMKTIAIVTLTFLPATFVTALLGMNFFSIDESKSGGRLTSTKDMWIYFVIAIPLTTLVICSWWWWQKREAKRAWNHDGGWSEKDVERDLIVDVSRPR